MLVVPFVVIYDLWGGAGAGVFIVGGRPPGNAHEAGVGVCGENSRSDCGFHWSESFVAIRGPAVDGGCLCDYFLTFLTLFFSLCTSLVVARW